MTDTTAFVTVVAIVALAMVINARKGWSAVSHPEPERADDLWLFKITTTTWSAPRSPIEQIRRDIESRRN